PSRRQSLTVAVGEQHSHVITWRSHHLIVCRAHDDDLRRTMIGIDVDDVAGWNNAVFTVNQQATVAVDMQTTAASLAWPDASGPDSGSGVGVKIAAEYHCASAIQQSQTLHLCRIELDQRR